MAWHGARRMGARTVGVRDIQRVWLFLCARRRAMVCRRAFARRSIRYRALAVAVRATRAQVERERKVIMYKRKTDDEIAALAKRLYRNEIFVSWSIDRQSDLPMVFMILNFLDKATLGEMVKDNIQFFYEEYRAAGPGSINGYPIFFSARLLSSEDGERLHAKVKQISDLVG